MTETTPVTTNGLVNGSDGKFTPPPLQLGADPIAGVSAIDYTPIPTPNPPASASAASPAPKKPATQPPTGIPFFPWASMGASGALAGAGVATVAAGPAGLLVLPVAGGLAAAAVASRATRTASSRGGRGTGWGLGPFGRSRGRAGATARRTGTTAARSAGTRTTTARRAGGGLGKSLKSAARGARATRAQQVAARKAAGPTMARRARAVQKVNAANAKKVETADQRAATRMTAAREKAAKRRAKAAGHGPQLARRTSAGASTARPTSARKSTVARSGAARRSGSAGPGRGRGRSSGLGFGGLGLGPSRKHPSRPVANTRKKNQRKRELVCGGANRRAQNAREKIAKRDKLIAEAKKALLEPTLHGRYKVLAEGFIDRNKKLKRLRLLAKAVPGKPGDQLREALDAEIKRNADDMRTLHGKVYGTIPANLWRVNPALPPTGPFKHLPFIENLDTKDQYRIIPGPTTTNGDTMNPFDLLPESRDLLDKVQRAEVGGALYAVRALKELPDAIQAHADAHLVMAQRSAAEMPLDPQISAALEDVYKSYQAAISAAKRVGGVIDARHKDDIARLTDAMRIQEEQWDRVRNGGPAGTSGESQAFTMLTESVDILTKIKGAEPDGMMGVIGAFNNLGHAVKAQSQAIRAMAKKAEDEMPFHSDVPDALEEVHKAYTAAIQAGDAVGQIARRIHAPDIERHEKPRTNEGAWDLASNQ